MDAYMQSGDEPTETYQLGAYHRVDLGMNWRMNYKEGLDGVWNISVLNVYNRANPVYYLGMINSPGTSLLPLTVSISHALTF